MSYVYADASNCKCAYVGDEEDYRRFQDLARQRQIDEKDRRAAGRDRPAELDGGDGTLTNPGSNAPNKIPIG